MNAYSQQDGMISKNFK